eukprot:1728942-Amphidinium_carterae.1
MDALCAVARDTAWCGSADPTTTATLLPHTHRSVAYRFGDDNCAFHFVKSSERNVPRLLDINIVPAGKM